MKLFCYYALHSVANQIKRLCRTWVAIFLLICILFGVLVGLGAGFLSTLAESDAPATEELLPEEEIAPPSREDILLSVDLIATAILLFSLIFGVLFADKGGKEIFLPADATLLFPSPLKPQSVLLFRLLCGLGTFLLIGIYFLFQLPNLFSVGLGLPFVIATVVAIALCIILSRFVSVFFYLLSAKSKRAKSMVRYGAYGFLLLLLLGVLLTHRVLGLTPFVAIAAFFSSPYSRLFPLFGWVKGMLLYAAEGNLLFSAAGLLLALGGGALLLLLCYRIKADFYEEALTATEEKAAKLAAAAEGRAASRKKERGDRLQRDGLRHGQGATVYFFKQIYNRVRFSRGLLLTKTSVSYLFISLAVSVIYLLADKERTGGLLYFFVLSLLIGGFAFFRALGNPIHADMEQPLFFMMPEDLRDKMLFSLLGSSLTSLIDLLPALLLATACLWVNPLYTLLVLGFILAIDLYSSGAGILLDVCLPTALDKNIRAALQITFVYFGLLPIGVAVALGWLLLQAWVGLLAGLATALLFACVFLLITPTVLSRGRK